MNSRGVAVEDIKAGSDVTFDPLRRTIRLTGVQLRTIRPVTQPWTWSLSFMQQTVLLELSRGPDGIVKYDPSKFLLRWFRRCILVSAFEGKIFTTPYELGGGSFTGPSYNGTTVGSTVNANDHDWRPPMDTLVSEYLKSVDGMPHHFTLHLMHGIEILGYKHPDTMIQGWWISVYDRFVSDAHLHPETEAELDRRLGDNRDQWLERADLATIA